MARKRARASRGPKRGTPSRRRRRSVARLLAIPIVLGLAALGWWTLRPREHGAAPRQAAGGYDQANQAALDLAHAGRHLEAIAYFREGVRLEPNNPIAHENLASGLGNGAQQAWVHLGKTDNAVRSSVERIAMMKETMAETEMAQRLARTASERVFALLEQGRTLYTWGFPIDALSRMRAAAAIMPQRTEVQASVTKLEHELATGTP